MKQHHNNPAVKNPRATAALVLCQVLTQRCDLPTTLVNFSSHLSKSDQALTQALCYGSLRWLGQIEELLVQLLHHPLRKKDFDIHCLLCIGLYQLIDMDIADYAAVNETVCCAILLKKIWAKQLINQTLRHFLREKSFFLEKLQKNKKAIYSHPEWLIEKISTDWPQQAEDIFRQNNLAAPMTLRVNRLKISRDDYLQRLEQQGMPATSLPGLPDAIVLEKPCSVFELPGWAEGLVLVQDGAAQFAALLLDLLPQQLVLDACAAPGGKTSHIAALGTHLKKLLAVEKNAQRATKIHENLTRLQQNEKFIQVITADVSDLAAWWTSDLLFDRILLDAPCTASGTIRRHPEIKWNKTPRDLLKLIPEQQSLLQTLMQVLKPGGLLLYCTCSIFPEENDEQIKNFMANNPAAELMPFSLPVGRATTYGWQILPGEGQMDGFFYCKIHKTA